MNNQDTPASAKEWSEFLSLQILPTGPFVGKQVLQLLKEDKLPYKKIAEQANKDPVFSYHILSKANQGKGKDAPVSKTLDHAISMIGTENLKQLTLSLPTHTPKSDNIQQYYYARAISSSLLASYLARAFSEFKKLGQKEDIYWGALFCGIPMWYLWRFATPEMKRVRHSIQKSAKLPQQAEREVLGCTIPELAFELVKHLSLPPLTKSCYSQDSLLTPKQWIRMSQHVAPNGKPFKVDDKHINLISSKPAFAITLANLLAYYASQDWYSHSTLRVQKVIAVYLGIPLTQAITLTHRCATDMSREHPIPGILLPAARLLLPPREKLHTKKKLQAVKATSKTEEKVESPVVGSIDQTASVIPQAKVTSAQTTPDAEHTGVKTPEQGIIKPAEIKTKPIAPKEEPTKNVVAADAHKGDKDVFTEFTDIMLKNPDNFVDLHELMNAATQCTAYGLGLQKAIVALVNTNETRLKAYYNVGTSNHPQLSSFQTDLTKPTLFSRLIEKPSSIWVKPTSNKNVWALIPPEFKVASGAKEFFLMSIFVNQKPVAVFYADSGDDNQPLTDYDYKQFKYMCNAATHCLQYLAAKRAKKA